MKHPISLSGFASISALGSQVDTIWESYQNKAPLFKKFNLDKDWVWVSCLKQQQQAQLATLIRENPTYKKLDPTVIMALAVARKSMSQFKGDISQLGINIGSSRGATHLFEHYYGSFLEKGKTAPLSSPTTTLGNIASWVAQDLKIGGIAISHSITCSSAMHAFLNGITWLESGRAEAFLVGGSEAPLTPFTIAQMKALKLYSKIEDIYACKAMLQDKTRNTMVFGEGATSVLLQNRITPNAQAVVLGVGWGSEQIAHPASISEAGECFEQSMAMALKEAQINTVDALVMHAPGTVLGDRAEFNAIKKVFAGNQPFLTNNKALIGHTLGASGGFSLEMAMLMITHNKTIEPVFYDNPTSPKTIKTVLINAVGFGANAVSIIIGKP